MVTLQTVAVLDACVLCSPVKRNLMLALAESGLIQIRWSDDILRETERAITIIAQKRQHPDAAKHASQARELMSQAFSEVAVSHYESFEEAIGHLPDDGDRHVIAAAIKCRADVIVTENLRDFPRKTLSRYDLEPTSSDDFILDIVRSSPTAALVAIERTRLRFKRSDKTPQVFLQDLRRAGLRRTADYLVEHWGIN